MPTLQEAHYRHGRYYLETLYRLDERYMSGGDLTGFEAEFDDDMPQVKSACAWSKMGRDPYAMLIHRCYLYYGTFLAISSRHVRWTDWFEGIRRPWPYPPIIGWGSDVGIGPLAARSCNWARWDQSDVGMLALFAAIAGLVVRRRRSVADRIRVTVRLILSIIANGGLEASLGVLFRQAGLMGDTAIPYANLGFTWGGQDLHPGVDIVAEIGEPVHAAGHGSVMAASHRPIDGGFVEVDHGSGVITRYTHLSRRTVNAGQRVRFGGVLGCVGATGIATSPHVHVEVWIREQAVSPLIPVSVIL